MSVVEICTRDFTESADITAEARRFLKFAVRKDEYLIIRSSPAIF